MAKKSKKRGVKPGTKRGPYKKKGRRKVPILLNEYSAKAYAEHVSSVEEAKPETAMSLCFQLEDSIVSLENRIFNTIAKINSLMR